MGKGGRTEKPYEFCGTPDCRTSAAWRIKANTLKCFRKNGDLTFVYENALTQASARDVRPSYFVIRLSIVFV